MSTAEQIIAEHRLQMYHDRWACGGSCGWEFDRSSATAAWDAGEDVGEMARLAHAAHVVAALTNAGYALVDLPEHADEALEEHGITAAQRRLLPITLDIDPAGVYLKHFSAKGARDLAAALLAAARVAEGGERRG